MELDIVDADLRGECPPARDMRFLFRRHPGRASGVRRGHQDQAGAVRAAESARVKGPRGIARGGECVSTPDRVQPGRREGRVESARIGRIGDIAASLGIGSRDTGPLATAAPARDASAG